MSRINETELKDLEKVMLSRVKREVKGARTIQYPVKLKERGARDDIGS